MCYSKFDSSIDLSQGKVAIALFCSLKAQIKEQHAIIGIELTNENGHQLYTLDFHPSERVNDNLYGNNSIVRWEDKIREGAVGVRVSQISVDTTSEHLFQAIGIQDGLIRSYRVGSYDLDIGKQLINQAREQIQSPPKFRYSGIKLPTDVPVLRIFNCFTWAKDLIARVGLEIDVSHFSRLLESTGNAIESSIQVNIPFAHTIDVSSAQQFNTTSVQCNVS